MNRKKIIKYMWIVLFLVILMVGCSKSVEIEEVEEETENTEQEYLQESNNSNSNVVKDVNDSQQIQDNPTDLDISNTDDNEQVASIIVKSENNLSDSEKQQIIDELSKEVDELLKEINEVE